jgi:hypothetical protein
VNTSLTTHERVEKRKRLRLARYSFSVRGSLATPDG